MDMFEVECTPCVILSFIYYSYVKIYVPRNEHFRFITEETQEKNQIRGEDGGCGDLSAL
jgi:hypothetical protein